MARFKSKIGLCFVIAFIIFAIVLDIKALSHDSMFSGLAAAFPAMPWIFIWPNSFVFGIFGLQALNIPFLYLIGLAISKIISKLRK